MRPLLRPLLAISACSALCACAGSAAIPAPARHTLAAGQSVTLAPQVQLTYDGVDDSRCPPDTRCVWAGKLTYRFTLRAGDAAERFTLTRGQPGVAPALLGGERIELDESVAPPPPAASQQAPTPHPVTVKVTAR